MSAYRRVLLGLVIGALLLALSVPFLRNTEATALLSLVVLIEAVGDVLATFYILGLVLSDRRKPRSWLLLMLFTTSALVTAGVVSIGFLVALRFLGYPPLAGSIGLLITGMGIVLLGAVPIIKGVLFFLVAHDPNAGRRSERNDTGPA